MILHTFMYDQVTGSVKVARQDSRNQHGKPKLSSSPPSVIPPPPKPNKSTKHADIFRQTTHRAPTTLTHKVTDRAPSPTPSERERLDKAAKAKEQEEQSKLPYKWTQTIADLEVTIEIPGNFKGKDLDVKIAKNSVKAGIKGQDAIIEVGYSTFR